MCAFIQLGQEADWVQDVNWRLVLLIFSLSLPPPPVLLLQLLSLHTCSVKQREKMRDEDAGIARPYCGDHHEERTASDLGLRWGCTRTVLRAGRRDNRGWFQNWAEIFPFTPASRLFRSVLRPTQMGTVDTFPWGKEIFIQNDRREEFWRRRFCFIASYYAIIFPEEHRVTN